MFCQYLRFPRAVYLVFLHVVIHTQYYIAAKTYGCSIYYITQYSGTSYLYILENRSSLLLCNTKAVKRYDICMRCAKARSRLRYMVCIAQSGRVVFRFTALCNTMFLYWKKYVFAAILYLSREQIRAQHPNAVNIVSALRVCCIK